MKKVLILIAAVGLLCGCKAEEAVDNNAGRNFEEVPAGEVPAAAAPDAGAPAADAAAEEAAPADTAGGEAAHAEGDGHGHGHGDAVACTCAAGKGGGTVWCEACSTGYINGEKNADKDAVMTAMAAK